MSRSIAYLSLGSNLGDRLVALRRAVRELSRRPGIHLDAERGIASVYETTPLGVSAPQPDYLNSAVRITTDLAPTELLGACLAIEQEIGRVRGVPGQARIIDIDLLLFDDLVLDDKALTLPHPRLHQRRFVLEPFAEIGAEVAHPVLGQTIGYLAAHLPRRANEAVTAYADRTWHLDTIDTLDLIPP